MRLAYANARFYPHVNNGGNTHIRQFVQNTVTLGHEVWMWPSRCHPQAKALPAGRMAQILKLRQMEVVYVRLEHEPCSPCTWTLGPIRQLLGDPLMVWEFNTVPERGKYLKYSTAQVQKSIEGFRRFGRGCDLAVCVSEHLADYVRKNLGIKQSVVVPNGSDPNLYTPGAPIVPRLKNIGDDIFNVVWIASNYFASWHNLKFLTDTANLIFSRGNKWQIVFHLFGAGLNQIGDMPANVLYYGVEDYEKLPQWMSGMDVGLCLYHPGPADYGSPIKLFDYMSSGLAVVATDQPQTRQILTELGCPDLLMSPHDPVKMADALEGLAANRERVMELSRRGRELIISKYTWHRAITDTFAEIEKIVAERRQPATRRNLVQ